MHAFAQWLADTGLSEWLKATGWAIPLLQSIHIVTIGVVFVSSLVIALRVLGRLRADEPFANVWARFAPWMWIGLVVMTFTGLLLVIAEPAREFTALSFWLKMGLLAVGVTGTAVFGRVLRPAGATTGTATAGSGFSAGARAAAIGLVALWVAVIFLGRFIAYDVEVWGTLSPQA